MTLVLYPCVGLHAVRVNRLDQDRYMVSEVHGILGGAAVRTASYRWRNIKSQPRTRLDLFKLDICNRVRAHQEQQARVHDVHSQTRELQPVAQVYIKSFSQGLPWLPWVIQKSKRPVSYTVELEDGCVLRQHVQCDPWIT